MLVGAYRDNEVGASHPLMRTLEAIRKAGARVEEIVLPPLGLDDVGCARRRCAALRAGAARSLWRNWCTRRRPEIRSSRSSSSRRWPRKGCSGDDPDAGAWVWDLARIRAHGYTDNVVDLMVEKLKRLSGTAQTALQQLACLGNVVEIASLSLVFGESEEAIHASLLEAVRAGLILRLEGSYAFLHDRIQEAAYALIPEADRAGAHLAAWPCAAGDHVGGPARRASVRCGEPAQSGRRTAVRPEREGGSRDIQPAYRTKGEGVSGLCVGARVFCVRHRAVG